MAKDLRTSVKLDVKSAERSLSSLVNHINKVQAAINKTANNGNNLNSAINKAANTASKLNKENQKVAASADKVTNSYKKTGTVLDGLTSKMRQLGAAYLGIMGAKLLFNTSDTITSTENKLNTINGGDTNATSNQMDKMYVAAQNARTDYGALMSNVGKSMTLSPDAFQNNIDNAIRFQELMAKSYTLGGASAAEQSSSMYQMIQALGSGKLAGDELRSVTEGAPMAAKAIEKYAQEVYNTTDALKTMGAEGKITSDIVVAAMMNMGDEIDSQFEDTQITFAQMWTMMKNDAMQAFRDIQDELSKIFSGDTAQQLLTAWKTIIGLIKDIFLGLVKVSVSVVQWIADNWNWLRYLIIGAITSIAIALGYLGYMAVKTAVLAILAMTPLQLQLLGIALIVVALVVGIVWLANTMKSGCDFMVTALSMVALAILLIGLITGSVVILIIGVVVMLGALFIQFADKILAVVLAVVSIIWNLLVTSLTNIIKGIILPLATAWDNFANFFGNLFNDPIAAIIHAFAKLGDTVLSILETIAKGIDAVFGSNLASAVSGWRDGLSSKADELATKYGNGTYSEKSNKTSKIEGVLDSIQSTLLWNTSDAYSLGESIGSNIQDKVGEWGSAVQDKLNMDNLMSSFPNSNGDSDDSGYDPSGIGSDVGDIADNTGSMADSMDMTEDDLEYLRKVADMEWKKEFTTANITVDMTNANTINGVSDLDGLVTALTDKLYEELDSVANGVYA